MTLVFYPLLQQLQQKREKVLEDLKKIASSDKGYKNYQEKLRTINPPCVPFLGEMTSGPRTHGCSCDGVFSCRHVHDVDRVYQGRQ